MHGITQRMRRVPQLLVRVAAGGVRPRRVEQVKEVGGTRQECSLAGDPEAGHGARHQGQVGIRVDALQRVVAGSQRAVEAGLVEQLGAMLKLFVEAWRAQRLRHAAVLQVETPAPVV